MAEALQLSPSLPEVTNAVLAGVDAWSRALILIDGASGTGKTSLAAHLESKWPSQRAVVTLHMDDLYAGWTGLTDGMTVLLEEIMPGIDANETTALRRYDWEARLYVDGGILPPNVDVIVEGCGSFVVSSRRTNTFRVWMEGIDEVRRDRALSRPDEDFARHWDIWDMQYQNYLRDVDPASTASMRVRSTG